MIKKEPAKLRKPSETKRKTPSGKTPNSSSRSKPKDKEEAKTMERLLDPKGEILLTYEKLDWSTVLPGQWLP